MSHLRISLFGKLTVRSSLAISHLLAQCKAQELLGYLLLFRARPHHREHLAELLWGPHQPQLSRKYLRKSLWQLQTFLATLPEMNGQPLLLVEPEWIQIHPETDLWLDVAVFETAVARAQGQAGPDLGPDGYQDLVAAARLYTSDLLEGCYQDWCILERERYREMYLTLMDKLMDYCERHRLFEVGIQYGQAILRQDRAREATYRRLIRMHYLSGDRASALRQFDLCRQALDEELHVAPDEVTLWLMHQVVRQDPVITVEDLHPLAGSGPMPLEQEEALNRIKELLEMQASIQQQLPREIMALEAALQRRTEAA